MRTTMMSYSSFGELERDLKGLATIGGLKVVVDDMLNHVVRLVMDHSAIIGLTGDLAADTRRIRRRGRLGRHVDASLGAVLMEVLVLAVVVVGGGGHDWRPVRVPVGVAEVAGVPVWAQLPPGKGVPVRGRDVKGGGVPQVHRQEGTPPAYLSHVFRPITRDSRNGYAAALEVPPPRQVHVRPTDGVALGVETTG
jgi:hypothetical protein